MTHPETPGSGAETGSDIDVVASLIRIETHLLSLEDKADHLDEQVHSLVRIIDEHRPLLARAAALADPGAKVRAMFRPRKDAADAVPQSD